MKKILFLFGLLMYSIHLNAQILKPVKWSYASKRISEKEAVLYLKASIEPGWHIYSISQAEGGPVKTSFTFIPSKDYTLNGSVSEPKPATSFDKNFNINVSSFEKSVVFNQKIKLKTAKPIIKGKVEFMVCNDKQCLPPEEIAFSIKVQ